MEYLKFLTQNKNFECGFLVFGFSSRVLGFFGLFLMFWLGSKLLRIGYWLNLTQILCRFSGKAINLKNVFTSKRCRFEGRDQNTVSCLCNAAHGLNNNVEEEPEHDKNEDSDEEECEDNCCKLINEEFRVTSLRKLIKFERKRAKKARNELDKERMAASSAAMEAMAVILRLQREKNTIEMEANQFRRMAEHKLEYDDQMINYLHWIVTKHESERNLLEDELRLSKEKLKLLTIENDELF
ncbi:protein FLOURY 1-like [Humulus lupulus]|uniref:protein FLOURY 1-like n=1 Tax=Humulus lupulus TaxID=3486 RepID=UPI002B417B54|nr:protein FLOURY 1-like [Humulus lupulus]